MTILDANVWVAYFKQDDSQHERAVPAVESAACPILVPEYVVSEVASILAQRSGNQAAKDFLMTLEDNDDARILFTDRLFVTDVIKKFLDVNGKQLSFADVALLVLARTHTVVTFDRQLANAIKREAKR